MGNKNGNQFYWYNATLRIISTRKHDLIVKHDLVVRLVIYKPNTVNLTLSFKEFLELICYSLDVHDECNTCVGVMVGPWLFLICVMVDSTLTLF